ncbi:MAG TPA: 23S rRNA (adenine(2503)-C(2))-methyltransferase RlmN [Gemmataceae bacterium]|jgi:23S rRNA (adenine2503-C2)-methyltransferase|nr:23S rRNA (adenine(2503)-C(2))-methyltransferase RlmN [Gemmataceae bacterium]
MSLNLVTLGGTARALLDTPPEEFAGWLAERRQPPMRARQIQRWLFTRRAQSFVEMTDLPASLRTELQEAFVPFGTHCVRRSEAADGTRKLLLRLADGNLVECVMIPEGPRRTACVSTQVGCGMGCVFCASGIDGVVRNLTTGEILEQLLHLRNMLPAHERLTHIVVMGMGEPLANLENLLEALAVAGDPKGLGIGARHITISTVGLPAKIRRLAELGKQYNLAVSLHAPTDALRTQIVPTNDQIGLEPILQSADEFFAATGRQVTFEYVLLGGVNDREVDSRGLAQLLSGKQAHVNLIPFNEVVGLPYRRPSEESLQAFVGALRQRGVSVKVRKRKGSEIDAACGQLRRTALAAAAT